MAQPPDPRPRLQVACGVLRRPDGSVLLTQRPPGKVAAGRWEFPGGKLEVGESPAQALDRELREELGSGVRQARRLLRMRHAYSDRIVDLDTWLVDGFSGEPEGREGQQLRWLAPEQILAHDVLPTVAPIVAALSLPAHYVFTPPDIGTDELDAGLARLPHGALLRLRLPGLSEAHYRALAARLCAAQADSGLRIVLDRDPEMAADLGAYGWHGPADRCSAHAQAARHLGLRRFASAHDACEVQQALDAGADALVIGTLAATPSHPGRAALGWAGFSALTDAIARPAYAIGGVGPADLDAAFAAGAQGVAGIRAFWTA